MSDAAEAQDAEVQADIAALGEEAGDRHRQDQEAEGGRPQRAGDDNLIRDGQRERHDAAGEDDDRAAGDPFRLFAAGGVLQNVGVVDRPTLLSGDHPTPPPGV
jgi:hypothetical protein